MEVFVPQPEFEEVSENIKSFGVTFQSGKELHQGPVVIVLRILQVGICQENLSHGNTIYEKRAKVKVEAIMLTQPVPACRYNCKNQERYLNGFYAGCGNNMG